jgi:hypothetical protein
MAPVTPKLTKIATTMMLVCAGFLFPLFSKAQCTDYNISVNNGPGSGQISWQLFNSAGDLVLAGGAPYNQDVCLDDDCYTLYMYDSNGDGWDIFDWVIEDFTGDFDFDTNLADGSSGVDQFETGNANCSGIFCAPGTTLYNIIVDNGNDDDEVYWELTDSFGNIVASGFAPEDQIVCLADDCYTLWMYDSGGDGWTGESWTLEDEFGDFVYSTYLVSGSDGSANFALGAATCSSICTIYNIEVSDGIDAPDVYWELYDSFGVLQAAGGANELLSVCLLDDCYSLILYDAAGDGWQEVVISIYDDLGNYFYQTFLVSGDQITETIAIGSVDCTPVVTCGVGTSEYTFNVSSGDNPLEISWYFALNNGIVQGGGAPFSGTVCLGNGCYYLHMFDQAGDGWNNATYTLVDPLGTIVQTGSLVAGSSDWILVNIGGLNCAGTEPPAPGACGSTPPSSDCFAAPCVCDIYNFHITPSGSGSINDVPAPGGTSNPSYFGNQPWGGNADFGCLLAGELNSSWMMFTVGTAGTLEFSFGAGGQQAGFYDWAMWPYSGPASCNGISNDLISPVRCVWNAASFGGAGLAAVVPPGGFTGNYGPPLNVLPGEQYIICLSNWSFVDAMVTLDFFGSATISCNAVLPVELLDFNGHRQSNEVLLHWETATEIDNDFFVVESSIDGLDWIEIGQVTGHGTTLSEQHYSLMDRHPNIGANYYRLKQYDYNGMHKISPVVAVHFEGSAKVSCQPNPAQDLITLNFNNDNQPIQIQIVDTNGKLIFEDKAAMKFPYQINTSAWNSATYVVKCMSEFDQSVTRLVIIR